jgi:hypothetical protein
MARLGDNKGWYTATAKEASVELGRKGVALILERLRTMLAA